MDWSGKGDGLDKGVRRGTMLKLAWMVFLKGLWIPYLALGSGYTGVYNFKTHCTNT